LQSTGLLIFWLYVSELRLVLLCFTPPSQTWAVQNIEIAEVREFVHALQQRFHSMATLDGKFLERSDVTQEFW
jgi:hypothetical protein